MTPYRPPLSYYSEKLKKILAKLSKTNNYIAFMQVLPLDSPPNSTHIVVYLLDENIHTASLVYSAEINTETLLRDSDQVLREAAMMAIMFPEG